MNVKGVSTRYTHIDALRGLAACAVLVSHCCVIASRRTEDVSAKSLILDLGINWFDLGRFGVVLFFLISGLVIPFSLKGEHALPRFAITRFFRLYPAFWLSLLLAVAYNYGFGEPPFSSTRVLANATMAPSIFHQKDLIPVYWTLFIELAFYLICAVLYARRVLSNPLVIWIVAIGCGLVPFIGILGSFFGSHLPTVYFTSHISFLLAGYLVRLWLIDHNDRARVLSITLLVVLLASVPLLNSQPDGRFSISTNVGVSLAYLAAVAIFIASVIRPFRAPNILVWGGAISYSIYLVHSPIAKAVDNLMPQTMAFGGTIFLVLVSSATIALAALTYRFVEKPCISAGRRVAELIDRGAVRRNKVPGLATAAEDVV